MPINRVSLNGCSDYDLLRSMLTTDGGCWSVSYILFAATSSVLFRQINDRFPSQTLPSLNYSLSSLQMRFLQASAFQDNSVPDWGQKRTDAAKHRIIKPHIPSLSSVMAPGTTFVSITAMTKIEHCNVEDYGYGLNALLFFVFQFPQLGFSAFTVTQRVL